MRKFLIPFFGLLYLSAFGQTNDREVYQIVDQMPYFPGCSEITNLEKKRACSNQNLITYISDYLYYPEKAKVLGIEGVVYLKFIISDKGEILTPEITRDIGGGCGDIALQIVQNMPEWEPGLLRGKPVSVALHLPVNFSLKNPNQNYTAETRIAWGDLINTKTSKERLLKNIEKEIIVRDLSGNPLEITELNFAVKKGKKIKEAGTRGAVISPKMKKLIKKLKRNSEFVILATTQINGQMVDVERVFKISK